MATTNKTGKQPEVQAEPTAPATRKETKKQPPRLRVGQEVSYLAHANYQPDSEDDAENEKTTPLPAVVVEVKEEGKYLLKVSGPDGEFYAECEKGNKPGQLAEVEEETETTPAE